MRRLLALVVLLVAAPAAHGAGAARPSGTVYAGPVFAGERVAWVEGSRSGMRLVVADPSTGQRTVVAAWTPRAFHDTSSLDASSELLVVRRVDQDCSGQCKCMDYVTKADAIRAGPVDGPLATAPPCGIGAPM